MANTTGSPGRLLRLLYRLPSQQRIYERCPTVEGQWDTVTAHRRASLQMQLDHNRWTLKSMTRMSFGFLFLVSLCASLPLWSASDRDFHIAGIVVNAHGIPMAGARVTAFPIEQAEPGSVGTAGSFHWATTWLS